jgi:hypothetical protein
MLCGVALGGADYRPAVAAPRETPARRISRLRAKAARVQARIDHMHIRIEVLVEDYNEVREALARTRAEQARTLRQVLRPPPPARGQAPLGDLHQRGPVGPRPTAGRQAPPGPAQPPGRRDFIGAVRPTG